jgi:TolA-binding protein
MVTLPLCPALSLLGMMLVTGFALIPTVASADTLWIGEPGTNPIKAEGVKVQQVDGDKVSYTTESGASSSKTFSQLQLINLDGETSFNSAENAFVARNLNDAITGYQAVLASTSAKDWMKNRAGVRLLLVAKELHRFDAQVAAYVALIQRDPATASESKPAKPEENSPYLDPALATINKALDASTLDKSQKTALLGLELEIYRAKKDSSHVDQTLQQLVSLGGSTPADQALLKIVAADAAYDRKQYTQAINDIQQNRALFTQPDQQVDALYVLAQAKEAIDGDKTDPDVLKDLALAYMRVVTFGSQLSDKPHVPEALFRVAQLEEKLKEPQSAAQLYKQIITTYPQSSIAADAKTAAAKLGK